MDGNNIAPYLSTLGIFLGLAVIWSLIWKAIALWKAGRNNHLGWYVALFLINTLGILEIIYIFIFSKKFELPSEQTAPLDRSQV